MTAPDAGRVPALARSVVLHVERGARPLTARSAERRRIGSDVFVRAQLAQRFARISLEMPDEDRSADWRRFLFHTCAAHLLPGAPLDLVVPNDWPISRTEAARAAFVEIAAANGLEPVLLSTDPANLVAPRSETHVLIVARWLRTTRRTIHDLVAEARRGLDRLTPGELLARIGDTGTVVLDTRTPTDREADGIIVGSRHAPRTVLEWMVDPASGYAEDLDADACLVVVCNEGYSSSLAARTLQELGFPRATDLVGGMQAWRAGGHPTVAPDGHHGRCLLPEDPRPDR